MRLQVLVGVIILIILGVGGFLYMNSDNLSHEPEVKSMEGAIRYLPIGDSYTIGNGVLEKDRWPNVLVWHLNQAGINIQIIGNPAVSGYTVEDALRRELPVVKQMRPDFVTVLIGANDNFRGTAPEVYGKELSDFLDQLQESMTEPKNIVLITIPDYTYSPAAKDFETEGVSESLEEYNQIIKSEAQKRGLRVADLFPTSKTMTGEEDYIADGLHPSAQGYAKWEHVIYPEVFDFLNTKTLEL